MPSRINAAHRLALAWVLSLAVPLLGAAPADLWPLDAVRLDGAALKIRLAALDAALPAQPPALQAAVRFEKAFLQIVSGTPTAPLPADIQTLAGVPGDDPFVQCLRDAARVWVARAKMQEIDAALRDHYRSNVAFPPSLDTLYPANPALAVARLDPWGDPWAYQPRAPKGFERFADQRYLLSPKRLPGLTSMRQAIAARPVIAHPWKITSRTLAGSRVLEFHTGSADGPVVAAIQPGGKVGDFRLAYAGADWVLLATTDQLVAAPFN